MKAKIKAKVKMKKVLVIGASGFLGKRIVKKLSEKHEVKCFIMQEEEKQVFQNKEKLKFAVGNIMDKDSLIEASKGIEVVVHLATSAKQNLEFNLKGSENVIEACKKNKCRIIFISSMAAKRKSLDEYGKMKLKIEERVKSSGLKYIIFRPSLVYSEDYLDLIGTSLFAIPFIIPVIGNGEYKISPIFIEDVAEAVNKAVETKIKNREYDLTSKEKISFNEIISIGKEHFNLYKLVIHVPIVICLLGLKVFPLISQEAIKGINEDTNADTTGIVNELNIKPINFKEGIKNVDL